MSIYRSEPGQALIRDWCEQRLTSWPEHERTTVDSSLGSTHLTGAGSGEVAILWLPGTNFNAATTAELASLMAARIRFYVVDLPGQPGLSAAQRLGRDRMDRYGPWLGEVVASIPEPRLAIAGHSLGAAIALAAPPSDRVGAVALLGPAGLARVRVTPGLLRVSLPWVLRSNRARAEALVRFMQEPASPVDGDLVEWMDLVARHVRQVGAPGPLPGSQLERWRGRALVATGAADRFFPPPRLESPTRQLLGTEVITIAGAGHLIPDEQAEHTVDLLCQWAERVAGR